MTDITVDVDTDDLEQFELLLNDKAKPTPKDEPETDVTDEPEGETDDVADEQTPEDEEKEDDAEDVKEEDTSESEDTEDKDDAEDFFKKKNRVPLKDRIKALTRVAKEAERREAEALRKLAAIESRTSDASGQQTPVKDGAPDPDSRDEHGNLKYPLGEFDPLFVRDLTRFALAEDLAVIKAKEAEEARQAADQARAERLFASWNEKLEAAEEVYEDIRPTIQSLDSALRGLDPEYGTYLTQTIMEMDLGPEVLYYLGGNPGEAQKIVAMGPTAATLALGRLEGRISSALEKNKKAEPEPVRVSAAPIPPPVNRGTGGKKNIRPDTDDLDAFESLFFK